MYSWKKIGPTTVLGNGVTVTYPSLVVAVLANRRRLNSCYGDFSQGKLLGSAVALAEVHHTLVLVGPGRSFVREVARVEFQFIDEIGFPIPVWVVMQAFSELIGYSSVGWLYRRNLKGVTAPFRRAPVVGTGRRVGRASCLRNPSTKQERSRFAADVVDQDLLDVGLRPRSSRGPMHLPTNYDSIRRSQEKKAWKRYRRRQFKEPS